MAKAISARRKGDKYQARVFWLNLLQLRTTDVVESVTIECEDVGFMDDVVVTYKPEIIDDLTGEKIARKLIQCKYHVTQNGSFTSGNLMDPVFIGTKQSMLERLYQAFQTLSKEPVGFRLYVQSNWTWHPDDVIATYLHEESIRANFFSVPLNSKAGRVREEMRAHLGITSIELESFLRTVRFSLGKNLTDLSRDLDGNLKIADLLPIDPTSIHIPYDDIAWELFAQGRSTFDRRSFEDLIHEEKLTASHPKQYSEISIRSFPLFAHRPNAIQSALLDLTSHFDGRYARDESSWNSILQYQIKDFVLNDALPKLPQPIRVFFDCHLSIAFLVGHLVNPKFSIQIVPVQKSRTQGYEEWSPAPHMNSGLWSVDQVGSIEEEVVVSVSVTNPLDQHLLDYLSVVRMDHQPQLIFKPKEGIGPQVISGDRAWQLGYELQQMLRERIPSKCMRLHLFFSGPAAMAYILGNTLRCITQTIQLYEHDFEGRNGEMRYCKSLLIANNE